MKHTPGPWKITETATHITVIGADNQTIFHDDKRCKFVVEDARLIAAAPDLLDACQAADWNSLDLPEFVREKLTAAIAKATGEQ